MTMIPRLIAIDVDGTLIDSKTLLRDDVIDAIAKARDGGTLVTLSTGRMISAAREYIDALGITLPIIALNGALIGWPGNDRNLVYHEPISRSSAAALLEMAWRSDSTLVSVCGDRALARNITDLTAPALASWIVNIEEFDNLEAMGDMDASTILVAGEKNAVRELFSEMSRLNLNDIEQFYFPSIRYPAMHYLEFRAIGTNKGKALNMLGRYLDIERESILSIGDYLNDIPMADESGIFAAPSNARDEVRAVADYVSPLSNDEGGVAEIIDRFCFRTA